jgi:hypothetical protein
MDSDYNNSSDSFEPYICIQDCIYNIKSLNYKLIHYEKFKYNLNSHNDYTYQYVLKQVETMHKNIYLNKQEIKALLIYIPLKQRNYISNYIHFM